MMKKYKITFWDGTSIIVETDTEPSYDEASAMWTVGENTYASVESMELVEDAEEVVTETTTDTAEEIAPANVSGEPAAATPPDTPETKSPAAEAGESTMGSDDSADQSTVDAAVANVTEDMTPPADPITEAVEALDAAIEAGVEAAASNETCYVITFFDGTESMVYSDSEPIYDEESMMWKLGENVYSSVEKIEVKGSDMPMPEDILSNVAEQFLGDIGRANGGSMATEKASVVVNA